MGLALGGVVLLFLFPVLMVWSANFLIANEEPQKAEAIVVLAGDPSGQRVLKGAELARLGFAPLVLVSGPGRSYDRNEADLAIEFAVHRNFPPEMFRPVYNRAHSTYEEAIAMLDHMRPAGIRSFIVVTSDFHTRRAGRIYRRLARDARIRVVAAPTIGFEPRNWWTEREARKTWLYEWQKLVADTVGGMLPDA
jgi:uncharacterized SAM-binding protein YcdF (DUF218 family)